jgi:hypothetical protein
MEFLENMLHVFLDRALAAFENRTNLAVAFARGDPFNNLKLALGEGMWPFRIRRRPLVNSG